MTSKCAFCGRKNVSLTKEHIYPRCLYESTPEQSLSYFPKIDKILETQVVIRDVCSECNNGELSKLDSYFCELFDKHIKSFVRRNETVKFDYDFDKLSRWLLKVSYNSARASKINYQQLAEFTDYILYNTKRPESLSLFVQLVIPYQMPKRLLETFPRANELQNGEVLPTMTRSGEFEIRRGKQKLRLGRMFAVNSYYFYVLLRPKEMREKMWGELIENIPSLISGATRLPRMKHSILLRASNIDTFTANKDFASEFKPAFQNWKISKQK